MQQATVKVSYHKMQGSAGLVDYLERDGAGEDGEKAVAFDASHDAVDAKGERSEWQAAGDDRFFHIILSPEKGDKLEDMKATARAVMAHAERDLDTKLQWFAVVHEKRDQAHADNRHVHIFLRGRDDKGRPLRIHRSYMTAGFRQRAGEVITAELGPRTEKEIRLGQEKSQQIKQQREVVENAIGRGLADGSLTEKQAKQIRSEFRAGKREQVLERLQLRGRDNAPEQTP
jgi:type IV secretory pathway VirD2 relaxase